MFSLKKDEVPARTAARPDKPSLAQLIARRFIAVLLALATAVLLGIAGSIAYGRLAGRDITIAAGSAEAESFVMMQALKTVAARYYPRIKVAVLETGGTGDSLKRLDKGEAQLAAAQADVPPGSNARTVAILFNDTSQLLVHKNSPIAHFGDLKGKKIALPRSGGQYATFLFLANHFGLKVSDFTFLGGDEGSANLAFARDEADALFRVRALNNAEIKSLVSSGQGNLIAIDDGAALHAAMPAYTPSIIPQGAYLGDPSIPPADIASISTQRLLLANRNVDKYSIRALTQVLIERREEIAAAIPAAHISMRPLAALISEPAIQAGLSAPMHPGALAFYNHDQGAFVTSNLDLIAFGLAGFVLIALWVSELRRLGVQGLKHHSDLYKRQLVEILEEASLESAGHAILRAKLNAMLISAIRDLNDDKMAEKSFRSFHIVWQTAMDAVREKPAMVHPQAAAPGDPGVAVAVPEPSRWSLSKLLQRAN